MAQAPLLPFSGDNNVGSDGVPSSETPWDSTTPTGARALHLLSKDRFPLTRSHELPMAWEGMIAPPKPQWPSPESVKSRSPGITGPTPIDKIYGVKNSTGIQNGNNPETDQGRLPRRVWDLSSANSTVASSRKIQWQGFEDHSLWQTAPLETVRRQRQEWVTRAFSHAWEGYKSHAWGFDEVRPLSNRGENSFAGWGATIVQSL